MKMFSIKRTALAVLLMLFLAPVAQAGRLSSGTGQTPATGPVTGPWLGTNGWLLSVPLGHGWVEVGDPLSPGETVQMALLEAVAAHKANPSVLASPDLECSIGPPINTRAPAITGTPDVSDPPLGLDPGGWMVCGGSIAAWHFSWSRGGSGSNYSMSCSDVGNSLTVSVQAEATSDIGDWSDWATSGAVAITDSSGRCSGGGGGGGGSAPDVSLTASATQVNPGTSVTITLNDDNSSSCNTIGGTGQDGWGGSVPPNQQFQITVPLYSTTQYAATCVNGYGSTSKSVTVLVGDTQPPTMPTNLHVTTATSSSITLAWSASSDNVGVAGYQVYLNGKAIYAVQDTSYSFTGLTSCTSYTLGIQAYDAAGNLSDIASITAESGCPDRTPPSQPGNLHVTNATQDLITLAWSASSDNVGVAGYTVYVNGSSIGTTTDLTLSIKNLNCATSFSLAVDAYDAAGNHSSPAAMTYSTLSCSPLQALLDQNNWSETEYDLSGNVLWHRSGTGSDQPYDSSFGSPSLISTGSPSVTDVANGCKHVDWYESAHSPIFGELLYRFHQYKYWCWRYPRIISVTIHTAPSAMDPEQQYDGLAGSNEYYYDWAGSLVGGHYSYTVGHFENCIFHYGCIGSTYPYVKIFVDGNGAWKGYAGGGA